MIGATQPVVLFIALMLAVLYRSPYEASNLGIAPDSVEYAVAANRFVTEGTYDILIEGERHPPRYPPWFSLLVIAPSYMIFGSELGNAIFSVTALAVGGMVAAWLIGRRFGSPWSALAAPLAVLGLSAYRPWATKVMIDGPFTATVLAACLLYLRLSEERSAKLPWFGCAGLVVAFATMLRPTGAALVLPLLPIALSRHAMSRTPCVVALTAPLFAVLGASAVYNSRTFGSVLRSGFHYWTPVPYDYPHLTFSLSYVPVNAFAMLIRDGQAVEIGAACVLLLADRWLGKLLNSPPEARATARLVLAFLMLGTAPMLLFHFLYFYPDARFFLPTQALLLVATGGLVGTWLKAVPERLLRPALLVGLAAVVLFRAESSGSSPSRRIAADRLAAVIPPNAVIITAIDPVYLEPLVARRSNRRILPISRRIEYADKLIARRRVPDPQPPPTHWSDHHCPGLLNGGAVEAVKHVAIEELDALVEEAARGIPLFLEGSALTKKDAAVISRIQDRFRLDPHGNALYELRPRE